MVRRDRPNVVDGSPSHEVPNVGESSHLRMMPMNLAMFLNFMRDSQDFESVIQEAVQNSVIGQNAANWIRTIKEQILCSGNNMNLLLNELGYNDDLSRVDGSDTRPKKRG